jgi:hypothetical protein
MLGFGFGAEGGGTYFVGLVAGVGKSDHGRPTMNKNGRSTLGSKMGDQWSTIGRPLVAHYWSTKVDRPLVDPSRPTTGRPKSTDHSVF